MLHAFARRSPPCEVRIVRLAPAQLDDDNLARACKAVRDEVAAWLGVDDRDPRVTWVCAQEKAPRGVYGVRILVRPTGPGHSCAVVSQEPDGAVIVLRLTRAQLAGLEEDVAVALSNGGSVVLSLSNARVVIASAGEP